MAVSNGISIAGNKYEGFKCDANKAITFKLVRDAADLSDNSRDFHPDMTHQMFGESESIFGYKDLRIEVLCSAARLTTCVNLKYSEKIVPEQCEGIQADNVLSVLSKDLQPGFLTNLDTFSACLNKDASFRPYGELVHSYTVSKDGVDRQFEVYKTRIEAPGFRDYHERLQPFLLFYVDAASFIDVDDERWDFFLLFEKHTKTGSPTYSTAGYMTVYNYYAYPEKIRPRISQVLVLPPFQRQGHGATLIQTFYNDCYQRTDILDITVEDPSENFQRVRDFVDAKNCMNLASFHPDKLCGGFCEEMVLQAREKLLINRKQARRIYEILRLRATNVNNKEEYRQYRLDVKRRLNVPFQKNGRDHEKLQRALQPTELSATINNMSGDQRLEYLQRQYEDLAAEYQGVIDRVAVCTD